MGLRKTTQEFIKESVEIHKGVYDYKKVEYLGAHKPVEIICKKHGSWFQQPSSHLAGNGCKKCAVEKSSQKYRKPYKEVIREAKKFMVVSIHIKILNQHIKMLNRN